MSLTYENSFDKLQKERERWTLDNKMSTNAFELAAGAATETGELLDLFLKAQWGRTLNHHDVADAVADCVIYLAGVCSAMGLSFGDCVDETWAEVRLRHGDVRYRGAPRP